MVRLALFWPILCEKWPKRPQNGHFLTLRASWRPGVGVLRDKNWWEGAAHGAGHFGRNICHIHRRAALGGQITAEKTALFGPFGTRVGVGFQLGACAGPGPRVGFSKFSKIRPGQLWGKRFPQFRLRGTHHGDGIQKTKV